MQTLFFLMIGGLLILVGDCAIPQTTARKVDIDITKSTALTYPAQIRGVYIFKPGDQSLVTAYGDVSTSEYVTIYGATPLLLSASSIRGMKGDRPMIIYVFDTRWPGKFKPSTLHTSRDRVEHFTVNENVAIVSIAIAVAGLSQGKGSIWLLRLCAHGNSGFLELGQGLTANSAQFLRFLKGYFTPGGPGIELHGCATGSSTAVSLKRRGLSCTPGGVSSPATVTCF